MTVLFQTLIDLAWIAYVGCIIGIVYYAVRALIAQRERSLSQFSLERESETVRMVRSAIMIAVLVVIGLGIFLGTSVFLPAYISLSPQATPTPMAGVMRPTPTTTPMPTLAATMAVPTPSVPTPPPPDTPTAASTEPPVAAVGGNFDPPVRFGDFAELVGYGLSAAEVSPSEPLELTLIWRSLNGQAPIDYMVFTHLLSEGENALVAQHDGQPANGASPTTAWAAGEVIEDVHLMGFVTSDYSGNAWIQVGLYNPSDQGERVGTDRGEERVVLPVTVTIVAQ